MNKYGICDKCKAVNTKSIVSKIKEFDKTAEFLIGCQNFCGIGRTKPFVILNNIPIIAENEEELIEKIKEKAS